MKKLVAVLITLALVFTLAACNASGTTDTADGASTPDTTSTDGGTTEPTTNSGEPVTLTLQIDKDSPIEGIEATVAAIEQTLGIKTEIEIRVGGAEGDNVIKTRLASGDMTDMFLFNVGAQLQSINPEEYLMDLSGEDYAESLIDDFKTAATVNGKMFGIPAFSTQAGAWLYNKSVYEELDLSTPQTWEELLANCKIIQDAGKVAVVGSYKDDWTSQLILLSEHYYVKQSNPGFPQLYTENKIKYADDPAGRRGFEKLAEIRPYLNDDYLATTYDVALDMLAQGDAAHYPMLTQGMTTIFQIDPELSENIGVFAQPGDVGEPGLTVWMPAAIYGYNGSDKQDAIKQWMEFYISQAGIDAYSSAVKANGPYAVKGIQLSDDAHPGVKEMQAYFDSGKTALAMEFESPVKGPNAPQICVSVGAEIVAPEEGAKQYDQDMEKQAIQLNLPGW